MHRTACAVVALHSLAQLALGALAAADLKAAATVVGSSECPDIGGFYTDPNHYKKGSFAGTRMISSRQGDTPSEVITLVGSDDGAVFWTLHGKFLDKSRGTLSIDFSPKGGPAGLTATFVNGTLAFSDGNSWSRISSLALS